MKLHQHISRLLAVVIAVLLIGAGPALAADDSPTVPEKNASAAGQNQVTSLGSYEVAPVRILGVPAIVVASPLVHASGEVVAAMQRAELIEGNLRLLYAPQSLCSQAEQLSENILEGLILGGPRSQRLCSGDPSGVSWSAEELRLEARAGPGGTRYRPLQPQPRQPTRLRRPVPAQAGSPRRAGPL